MSKWYLSRNSLSEADLVDMTHEEVLDWLRNGGCDTPKELLGEWDTETDSVEDYIAEKKDGLIDHFNLSEEEAEAHLRFLWESAAN